MTVYMKKGNKIVKTLKKDAIAAALAAATMSGGMVLVIPVNATETTSAGYTISASKKATASSYKMTRCTDLPQQCHDFVRLVASWLNLGHSVHPAVSQWNSLSYDEKQLAKSYLRTNLPEWWDEIEPMLKYSQLNL